MLVNVSACACQYWAGSLRACLQPQRKGCPGHHPEGALKANWKPEAMRTTAPTQTLRGEDVPRSGRKTWMGYSGMQ